MATVRGGPRPTSRHHTTSPPLLLLLNSNNFYVSTITTTTTTTTFSPKKMLPERPESEHARGVDEYTRADDVSEEDARDFEEAGPCLLGRGGDRAAARQLP